MPAQADVATAAAAGRSRVRPALRAALPTGVPAASARRSSSSRSSGACRRTPVRIDSLAQLDELVEDGYPPRYARIAVLAGLPERDVHGFLAEELLAGAEVTLEGYVHRGARHDDRRHRLAQVPGHEQLRGLRVPVDAPADAARRARRAWPNACCPALGFDDGFFNMELFVPERRPGEADRGQRAHRVAVRAARPGRTGTLDLRGAAPARLRRRPGLAARRRRAAPRSATACASSRTRSSRACPSPTEGVEILVEPGRHLSEQGTNDAESYRLAIFHEVGETREEALAALPGPGRVASRSTSCPPGGSRRGGRRRWLIATAKSARPRRRSSFTT